MVTFILNPNHSFYPHFLKINIYPQSLKKIYIYIYIFLFFFLRFENLIYIHVHIGINLLFLALLMAVIAWSITMIFGVLETNAIGQGFVKHKLGVFMHSIRRFQIDLTHSMK